MTTFEEILRSARTSPAVIFDKFIRNYTRTSRVHLFFEGADDPSFYMSFVERFVHPDLIEEPYICDGKDKTFETYSKISTRLAMESDIAANIRVLFFVDKDHSDIDGETLPISEVIFVTEYYSIENYLVSRHIFRRIWREYFHFLGNDRNMIPECEDFEMHFSEQLGIFHGLMIPIMAWIIAIKRFGEKPVLNQLNLDNLFSIGSDLTIQEKVSKKYSSIQDALEKMCNVITPIDAKTEIIDLEHQLGQIQEPKLYVRGKFELWFFSKFIKKLAENFQKSTIKFKFRSQNQIESDQIIHSLGPRCNIPDSLHLFLSQHLTDFPLTYSQKTKTENKLL